MAEKKATWRLDEHTTVVAGPESNPFIRVFVCDREVLGLLPRDALALGCLLTRLGANEARLHEESVEMDRGKDEKQ